MSRSHRNTRRPRRRAGLRAAAVLAAVLSSAAAATTLEQARRQAADGDLAGALESLDAVLTDRPGDVSVRLLQGVLLSRSGRSTEAIDVFRALAAEHPDLPEPHNNLAVLYAAAARYAEARDALLEAIRLQPDYDIAHENLGDVYSKLAALSYGRAVQINEANTQAAAKRDAADRIVEATAATGSNARPEPAAPPRATSDAPAPIAAPAVGSTPAPEAAASRTAATPADVACVKVPVSSQPHAERLTDWFREHGLSARGRPGDPAASTAHWVLIPPLPDAAAARERLTELKAAGISDVLLFTRGEHANGISLGLFKQRSGAERRVRELARRGVTAQVTPRNDPSQPAASETIEARGPFDARSFAASFPNTHFTIEDCP